MSQIPVASTFVLMVLVIAGLAIAGCKSGKSVQGEGPGSLKLNRATEAITKRPDYRWFDGRARLRIDSEDLKVSLTATIRMEKDKVIWATMSKFGLEMARIKVTPDSAFIINRLQKEYYAESIEDYLEEYKIPFGFSQMQDVILGLPVLVDGKAFSLEQMDPLWLLQTTGRSGLKGVYMLENGKPVRVRECIITDPENRSFTAKYSAFERCKNSSFETAFERHQVLVSGLGTQTMEMRFTEITIDKPVDTPFAIPNYSSSYD